MGETSGIAVEKVLGYFEGHYLVMAEDCCLPVLHNGSLLEVLTVLKY